MLYTLTEKEYSDLVKSNMQFEDLELKLAQQVEQLSILKQDYRYLQDKYNKLLVFGVSLNNEKRKAIHRGN